MFYLPDCFRLSERTDSGFITSENKHGDRESLASLSDAATEPAANIQQRSAYCGNDEWRQQVRFIFGSSS